MNGFQKKLQKSSSDANKYKGVMNEYGKFSIISEADVYTKEKQFRLFPFGYPKYVGVKTDKAVLAAQHKRVAKNDGKVYIGRAQIEELRKLESDQVEALQMKWMGMEVKESMGVRYERDQVDEMMGFGQDKITSRGIIHKFYTLTSMFFL
ncbi:hypothetical protein CROQUDRAFT_664659 [Cronartium quercuum f. sp. fusiforme G11]|uniref:Uncharacterized protein n=1 Tax=Cronartium quercuum f. sp. fusiforme G11 TaxID=708437 RepID=A0A9P6T6V7_9BASI|nr:hypothetical protein CROQUDRAFT_664659 [Cronartium quercuum f. sp. fusiforme G11]